MLAPYCSRFRCAHWSSFLSLCSAVCLVTLFVSRRTVSGKPALPWTLQQDVQAVIDQKRCNCQCGPNQTLVACSSQQVSLPRSDIAAPPSQMPAPSNPRVIKWRAIPANLSQCLRLPDTLTQWQGPDTEIFDCHCYRQAALADILFCQAEYSFSEGSIRLLKGTTCVHLIICFLVLLWDFQYLFSIYFIVVPSVPEDLIDLGWLQRWLQQHVDPLHALALWIVWGQLLVLTFAPVTSQDSPFPGPRDFVSPTVRHRAGFGPTGLDELLLWCSVAALALSSFGFLFTTRRALESEIQRNNVGNEGALDVTNNERPQLQAFFAFFLLMPLASIGFLLGQPISSVYAVLSTLPFWLAAASQLAFSNWPLERPFPSFPSPWSMRKSTSEAQDRALQKLRSIDTSRDVVDLQLVAQVQNVCMAVQDIRRSHPWRAVTEFETEVKQLVLQMLRCAVRHQTDEVLQLLVQSALMLGYVAPQEEEDEEIKASAQRKSGCCGCRVGYQKLNEGSAGVGSASARDELWSGEVHSCLRDALNDALVATTSASASIPQQATRWLSATLSCLQPDAVQTLSGHVAHAADALRRATGKSDWDHSQLFHSVAMMAGLHPDTAGASGINSFGWAFRLPPRQAAGTLSLMLLQLESAKQSAPQSSPMNNESTVEIICGNMVTSGSCGMSAFTVDCGILCIPDLAVDIPGRWFFEVRLLGHVRSACRLGWLHKNLVSIKRQDSDVVSKQNNTVLPNETSCSFHTLSGVEDAATLSCASHGIIGCALEIQDRGVASAGQPLTMTSRFAFNGNWGERKKLHFHMCEWNGTVSDGPVIPAVSGQLACQFVIDPSHYVHGPPDESFAPLMTSGDVGPMKAAAGRNDDLEGQSPAQMPSASVLGKSVEEGHYALS